MRFAYYEGLSAKDKREYRQSDEIAIVLLPDARALQPLALALAVTLEAGKRKSVEEAAKQLCAEAFRQLGVACPIISVKNARPRANYGELHGLYTLAEDGTPSKIEVWMRTAAHRRIVRYKTFLATLVHEMVHHLDVEHYGLRESFHTAGFFRRISSIVKQIIPVVVTERTADKPPRRATQLSLFGQRN